MKKYKGFPDLTDSARKEFDRIMKTLGKKTKTEFIEAIVKESEEIFTHTDNTYINLGDILRIAKDNKFE